jgi:hypothetical protein
LLIALVKSAIIYLNLTDGGINGTITRPNGHGDEIKELF